MRRSKKKTAAEIVCCTCGVSWKHLCERPESRWTDPGIVHINRCSRCGKDVCHRCYSRWGGAYTQGEACAVLCPVCFDLPAPTLEDAAQHPLAKSHGLRYARWIMEFARWRYEEPWGQCSTINPLLVWYYQDFNRDDDANPDESLTKEQRKHQDRVFGVVNGYDKPRPSDDAWLPAWGRAILAEVDGSEEMLLERLENRPPIVSPTFDEIEDYDEDEAGRCGEQLALFGEAA